MNPPLTLIEWQRVVDVPLDADEATSIRSSGAGIEVGFGSSPGTYTLRATHIVGTLVLRRRVITLLPKVPVSTLFELLGWLDAPRMGQPASGSIDPDVGRAMARCYLSALERALGRSGVFGEWLWSEQDATAFSGRVNWRKVAFERFGLVPPIPVRTLELDEDSPLNRRLLAALDRVRRLVDIGRLPADPLGRLLRHFVHTSLVRRPEAAAVDRRTARFEVALRIADAILENTSIRFEHGERRVATFLVDMNLLFERFLLGALAEELRRTPYRLWPHPRGWTFDEAGRLPLSPDGVVVDKSGRACVILDAKYKFEVTQADRNQVLAYCVTGGTKNGVLVVVAGRDENNTVQKGDMAIHVRSLNLHGEADAIRNQVRELAGFMVELASTASE